MKTKSYKHFASSVIAFSKRTVTLLSTLFLTISYCSAQNPIANFQANQTTLCDNYCINFSNLSTNSTSWQWSFSGAIDSLSTAQNPQNICYLTPGNYNVTLIAISGSKRDTLTLTNYISVFPSPPTPVITQSYDTLYCSSDPSYTSYQWYADSTLINGATDTFLVISQNGNYNVLVTNENGCMVAVGINIIFNGPPISNFNTYDSVVCANSCISFNNLSSNGTLYQWSFPGGVPSSSVAANPPNVCYDSVGFFPVILISINSNGSDTLTRNNYIRVAPALVSPVITQSNDTLFCSTNAAYFSYQWFLDGNVIYGATDTLFVVSQNGNYTVQVYSSGGCSLNASFTYTLFHPIANFSASDSIICVNGCVNFNNLSQNYTSAKWLFPGGTPSSDTTDTITPPMVCYNSPGAYNVTLIVSDGFNSDTLVLNNYITVNSGPPAPVVTQSNDTLFSTTNLLYTSYQWYKNNVIINGAVDTLLPGVATNNVYMVSVTNSMGCASTGSITLGTPITAFFSVSDSFICGYNCINFTNLSSGATSWKWIFNGATPSISTDQNPQNICYDSSGNYNVTLIAINGGGSDTLTLSNYINVLPGPVVPVITQSNDTLFIHYYDSAYYSYSQWYFDSAVIAGATDTFLVVTKSGNYQIKVTSQNGCSTTAGYNIIVGAQCSANFSITADTSQLHHYIVTNNATGASPISYYWSWGDGTHDTIPYPTHTYADSGFYTICLSITDANSCMSTFCDSSFHAMRTTNTMVSMTVVPGITGVQTISIQKEEITLYPNPATNQLTVHFLSVHTNEAVTVSIMNVLGEIVQEEQLKWSGDSNINIGNLSQGMYFLQMKTGSGSFVQKFVKE